MRHSAIAVFAIITLLLGRALGHSCDSCDLVNCEHPTGCAGGVVTDICNCCYECAHVQNESCGGLFEMSGKCDEGLICIKPPPKPGQLSTGNEVGVCLEPLQSCKHPWLYSGCNLVDGDCLCTTVKSCEDPHFRFSRREDCFKRRATLASKKNATEESNGDYYLVDDCSEVKCFVGDRDCPADSVYIPGEVPFGECCRNPGTCHCSEDKGTCHPPSCPAGQQAVIKKKSSGNPGDCCDTYTCQPSDMNCSHWECPEDTVKCPMDSYRLPSIVSPGKCCSVPQGCSCLPRPCPPVWCPPDTKVSVTVNKTGEPGACCTQFVCIKDLCIAGGQTYQNGSTWRLDNCKTCTCVNGLSVCATQTCPDIKNCKKMDTPAGECCPVCTGCVDHHGVARNNNDVWMPDKCTTCNCNEGVLHCYAERCGPQMAEITFPPGCPLLHSCDLHCVDGYAIDERNCFVCRCKQVDDCNLKCEHGRATDEQGNFLCECCECAAKNLTSVSCRSVLANCKKECVHGYVMDENGCPTCKCERCRKMDSCVKKCPYGYRTNDRGCSICKCRDAPQAPVATTDSAVIAVGSGKGDRKVVSTTLGPWCHSSDGRLYEDGESWNDGCRPCYCHGGVEMCALITCPVPTCDHPTIFNSHCCTTCLGDVLEYPVTNVTVCHSVDGHYKTEGETWMLDTCTRCTCHDGNVMCGTDACPPVPCDKPTRAPDSCCSVCSADTDVTNSSETKDCALDDGTLKMDGQSWRVSVCQSCSCHRGEIKCFSEKCPSLKCDKPILRKNQCCPMCIEGRTARTCKYHDVIYGADELWSINNCITCICKDGSVNCTQQTCGPLCPNPIIVPGKCCPMCPDVDKEKITTTEHSVTDISLDNTDDGMFSTIESDVIENGKQNKIWIIIVAVVSIISAIFVVAFMICRRRCVCYVKKQIISEEVKNLKPRPKSAHIDGSFGGYVQMLPIFPGKCHMNNAKYSQKKFPA